MKKPSCFFLALFFYSLICYGQVPYFQYYSLLKKNEPVQVNAIMQGKSGYIWFGTNKGLFRFDGKSTRQFTSADKLPDENVTAVVQDSLGRIWTGHKNGKIAILDNASVKEFNPPEGLSKSEISDMFFDSRGILWFSTLGDGLYFFRQNRLFRLDEDENLPDLFVYTIAENKSGQIMAGTDAGVAICSLNTQSCSIQVLNYETGLPDNIVKKLIVDTDGIVWMGTEDKGILAYNLSTKKYESFFGGNWKHGVISDFIISGTQVWIFSLQDGLVVYDRKTKETKIYNEQDAAGLSAINALLTDQEGNIWAGTKSGVLRTPGNNFEFINDFGSVKDKNIIAIAVDHQNSIWFSNSEGLFRRKSDNQGKIFIEKQLTKTSFVDKSIISLFTGEDGFIWAGTYGEGVLRIDPTTGNIRQVFKELRDGNILNISGRNNEVWLATLGGGTRIKVSGSKLEVRNYSRSEGLSSDYIYQVFIDSQQRVWFATDGKGVDMLDSSGFHHYETGLASKVVYGFAEDTFHQVWLNVQDNGLYKFNGNKFEALHSANNLRSKNISALVSDNAGHLFAMHDLGIDIYEISKNRVRYFGEESGIRYNMPNLNAVTIVSGNIYFGTDEGIIMYSGLLNNIQKKPAPYIDGFKVLNSGINDFPEQALRYNQNDITINYLGFWYQNPEAIRFEYMLENYDKNWISSTNHSVTYSSLPPGKYIFRLRASDQSAFADSDEATFSFEILPPFWQTTSFYILCFITMILTGYVVVKLRVKKLKRANKILEEKNTELKKINGELDKFVYSVSHDLRAPLSSMLGIVKISKEDATEPLLVEHLGMLEGSINKLDGFIQDILDYSRNSRLEIKKEQIDFNQLIDDVTNNLKYIGYDKHKVEIKVEVNDTVPFHCDRNRLNVILNNLISNAIRYQDSTSDERAVKIKVDTSDTETNIVVKDNGIGISRDQHEKIFNMFYRVAENSVGSGLGLYLVKETVDKLNGHITVQSELGKGSEFHVHIPNN
jgi:signal transduction histidine kinase/ligand-binding sensor domain-containing protein